MRFPLSASLFTFVLNQVYLLVSIRNIFLRYYNLIRIWTFHRHRQMILMPVDLNLVEGLEIYDIIALSNFKTKFILEEK